jgi:hypothetical protein
MMARIWSLPATLCVAALVVSATAVFAGATGVAPQGPDGFATIEPVASGRTFYVSGTGSDDASGLSQQDAFRTLQHASEQTAPGDTVYAMDGTYTSGPGSNVLDISMSGTPNAWIRYMALPGQTPTVKVDENWGGISIGGASFILIDGFVVVGGAEGVTRDEAFAEQDDLENQRTIANCIGAAPTWNDETQKPHHLIIRNNTVSYCPGGGIYTNQSDYVRIEDNVVHHNAFWSPWGNSGISVYQNWNSDSSTASKIIIRRNVSYSNESIVPTYISDPENPSNRVVTDGNGIIIDDSRNTQSYSSTPGTPYTGRTLVENNLVYDNGGRGITVYSSDHVLVRFNTSSNNAQSAAIESDLSVTDAEDVQVRSNIIVARTGKIATQTANISKIDLKNNLYWGGTTGFAGGRIADPEFASADDADFRLTPGSPAVDAATTKAPAADLVNVRRPQGAAADIGAYEKR